VAESGGNRRIDRILRPDFAVGLAGLPLAELRRRRDECLVERESLSLLRRLVQGRAEILRAEVERRGAGDGGSLVDRLSTILAGEGREPARGEAVRVGIPKKELTLARRRVERLVADAGLSDPGALDDEQLSRAVGLLSEEERKVSEDRGAVISVLEKVQRELKRRYKEDPSRVLS
jgi:hypothetical protein